MRENIVFKSIVDCMIEEVIARENGRVIFLTAGGLVSGMVPQ